MARYGRPLAWALACAAIAGAFAEARAQSSQNPFGGQDRADAAARMIVLGVQQGISSLPPTSAQSFVYEWDGDLQTFLPSERLGPISFHVPQTLSKGSFSVRLATSAFELSDTFGPVDYFLEIDGGGSAFAKFGLAARATVGVINLGGSYGVSERAEVSLNLPLVVVDATASQAFTTRRSNLELPASKAIVTGAESQEGLEALLAVPDEECQPDCLRFRSDRFSDLGFRFNEGAHVGIGRISVGAKGLLWRNEVAEIAFAPELFFPSPSQNEFAGSESFSILPRLVAAFSPWTLVRLHAIAGYDYDFDNAELRRFLWSAGASLPLEPATFDLGFGGSEYDVPIRWTPARARVEPVEDFPGSTLSLRGDNVLDDSDVDFLAGVKAKAAEHLILGLALNVPVSGGGFRADVLVTLAAELLF